MDDYAYINARIRSWRGGLVDRQTYEAMQGQPDVSAVRSFLSPTIYGKRFEDIPADDVGALEEALRREWSQSVLRLHRITDGLPREHLEILLGRWEVENLKAILRGKRADIGVSEILATVLPTGIFDEAALAELAQQPSIEAIVDLLTTWRAPFAKPLKAVLKGQRELKGLESLELALDHYYFRDAVGRLEEGGPDAALLQWVIGLMIDKVNLLTVVKISREGVATPSQIPHYFVEGGKYISLALYHSIIGAKEQREILELIKKTPYSGVVERLEREGEGILLSVRLERELERAIMDKVRVMSHFDPLGIGLMIGYLFQKYHEICNLRILLRAKAYDMYPEDIRPLLVL